MAHLILQTLICLWALTGQGRKARTSRVCLFFLPVAGHVPERISPPDGRYWSRPAILDYLRLQASDRRVLAGIDFAFAYPVTDGKASICGYFPDFEDSPDTAHDLWALIEGVNADQQNLYGGGIWDHPRLGPYYNAPGGRRGDLFASRRRLTEQVARDVKSPSPTFNCVGPAGWALALLPVCVCCITCQT